MEKDLELQQQFEERLKATRAFRATSKKQDFRQEVDKENGCIYGVSVCTEGAALGHGCWLDSSFIEDVKKLGNEIKIGLKARFGHPAMSGESFGTFVGRFHNFRVEGTQVFADLHFDESAKITPNGDLYSYILNLAANDPEAFGTSIVFTSNGYYFKKTSGENIKTSEHRANKDDGTVDYALELDSYGNPKYYISMGELWGCDVVDEPAANPNGLFSSANFNKDKFAVIATQFLDRHPKIAELLANNPNKLTEFLSRYQSMAKPVEIEEAEKTPVIESKSFKNTIMKFFGIEIGGTKADNGSVTFTAEQFAQLLAASTKSEESTTQMSDLIEEVKSLSTEVKGIKTTVEKLDQWADATPAAPAAKPNPSEDNGGGTPDALAAGNARIAARLKK